MDITHFTFAFFVFILLCALIWLNGRISRGRKKDESGSFEKEQRLFRLYQNIEDMLASFEEYAEAAKKEISAGLGEMNALMSEVKNETVKTQDTTTKEPQPKKTKSKAEISQDDAKLKPEERIPMMAKMGMSKSEIAKELGLSIREVTLIMDLKKITISGDKS